MSESDCLMGDIQPFCTADAFDNISLKDDIASMAYPIFTLSKNKDMRCLKYSFNNISITITPSILGLPTILDKDIMLYCGSILMKEINNNNIPSKTLRISSRDLLISICRDTGGASYNRLKKSLDRLAGVKIKTNIKTNNKQQVNAFGLIDSYGFIESSRIKNRMLKLEITLSDWFYNSILGKEALTINKEFFRLQKPLEKRLYEIARKFCGKQTQVNMKLDNLFQRVGSQSTIRKFRYYIKRAAQDNNLPDYSISIDKNDIVYFTPKSSKPTTQQIKKPINSANGNIDDLPEIRWRAIETGRKIVKEAGTGWSFQEIQTQFALSCLKGNFQPDNPDGAFIEFVRNKVKKTP